jgi:hypothetical protein
MLNVTKEYLLLFNAITDAEEMLQQLRSNLIAAQQKAEELFVEEEPSGRTPEDPC